MKLVLIVFFVMLFCFDIVLPQTVYEPVNSNVYEYLDNLSTKGIVVFYNNICPLSRSYIALKLLEVKNNSVLLNDLEFEQLKFYIKDYGFELESKDSSDSVSFNWGKDKYDRYRLFSYNSSLFKLNLSPILGYSLGDYDNENYLHRWNGASIYGYIGSNIGFSFNFRDNLESNNVYADGNILSSCTGIIPTSTNGNSVEYSEIRVGLTYSWDWGDLSIGKDFFNWGYGQNGKIVSSTKPPSFPYIRLDIHPVEWFRFNYIHGWLKSNLTDSTRIYESKKLYRNKYIASHSISIIPFKGIEFSLGESIIYSDKIEFSYLIPIMFFRLADHYLANSTDEFGGNAQFFFSLSAKNIIPTVNFYTELIMDDFSLRDIFINRNKVGYTIGVSILDFPVKKLKLMLEYSKIAPFVYEHNIPGQDYKNSDYVLGHWMGNNADLFYLGAKYYIIRGLSIKSWFAQVRKGAGLSLDNLQTREVPLFLAGYLYRSNEFGINLSYEIVHDLFASIDYKILAFTNELSEGAIERGYRNIYFFSFNYGF
ncbi:MAG: capsule assembly Wzi family protein [Bacteroidetes bacterium]|nr:capsule assembly Wzi family protein [Bacteroidota bacterium]MBU1114854.1 capsule assembly Wzi family protein [Bacteroidota bacterium]MBU1800463.1 capsule assembly Wzi family protein [Bacteroidota bacterium]